MSKAASDPRAFFEYRDGLFWPGEAARGTWAAGTVSGRLIPGLATHALEREQAGDGLQLGRLTVDLFRAVPFEALAVSTRVVRKGGRIRVVDVEVAAGSELVSRTVAVYLRPSQSPAGAIWHGPRWERSAPDPDSPNPRLTRSSSTDVRLSGERTADPGVQRGGAWTRERLALVADVETSPLVRAALAADLASPITNHSVNGLSFINTDVTLQLVREPVGEFFGVLASDHYDAAGVSAGQAVMHDRYGILGFCAVTALANPGKLRDYTTPA